MNTSEIMGISPKTGDCSSQGSHYQPFDYDNLRYLLSYSQADPTQPQSQKPREQLATWLQRKCCIKNLFSTVLVT